MKITQYLPIIIAIIYYVYTIIKGLNKTVKKPILNKNEGQPAINKIQKVDSSKTKSSVIQGNYEMVPASMIVENPEYKIENQLYPKAYDTQSRPKAFEFNNLDEVRKAIIMKEILDKKYF